MPRFLLRHIPLSTAEIIVSSIEGLGLQPFNRHFASGSHVHRVGLHLRHRGGHGHYAAVRLPAVTGMGYDPIWWGVINVVVVEMGMITPPIGLNVFVLQGMAKDVPFSTIYAGIGPFLISDVIRLLILTLFPVLTLWLPKAMGLM